MKDYLQSFLADVPTEGRENINVCPDEVPKVPEGNSSKEKFNRNVEDKSAKSAKRSNSHYCGQITEVPKVPKGGLEMQDSPALALTELTKPELLKREDSLNSGTAEVIVEANSTNVPVGREGDIWLGDAPIKYCRQCGYRLLWQSSRTAGLCLGCRDQTAAKKEITK